MSKYYYHGSKFKIKGYLEPRPSPVINNEKAVFATNELWISLISIPKFKDNAIDYGYIGGYAYILELEDGAFKLLEVPGYIYVVSKKGFKSDKRLGMPNSEFINKKKVKIQKTIKIKNVLKALKKLDTVTLITSKKKDDLIYDYLKEKSERR